jgi:phosphatidylserine decarboxylase
LRTLTQYLLPHKIISLIAHLSANCEAPWIKNYLIGYFIKRYAVNMPEAIQADPFAYASYNKFFTRQLKPEARPIDQGLNSIVSPADGAIAQIGALNHDQILQAKQHNYSVQSLLGDDPIAEKFVSGNFVTVYLAPKDYHRVHMPLAGRLTKMLYIPGKLFSVNTHAAENIPSVFARNERVVAIFETAVGPMAVILVGAMIVGSIETVWAGAITPPHTKKIKTWHYETSSSIVLDKGAELGLFKLGSTVIVLFGPQVSNWDPSITATAEIKMGQKIGSVNGA